MCPKPQQLKSTDGIHTLEFYLVYQRTSNVINSAHNGANNQTFLFLCAILGLQKSHQNKTIRVVKIFFGSTTEITHLLQVITALSYVVRTYSPLRSV